MAKTEIFGKVPDFKAGEYERIYGEELTKDNCSAEIWRSLGGDLLDDPGFDAFFKTFSAAKEQDD